MTDPQLQRRALPLLDDGEQVRGAFVVAKGMRPGMEAVGVVGSVVLIVFLPWLVVVVSVVSFLAVLAFTDKLRAIYTVVLTDSALVLAANRSWRWRRPVRLVERMPLDTRIGVPDMSGGDRHVTFGGNSYWVLDRDIDEARRVARLCGPR